MRTPDRFRVETQYQEKQEGKANTNPLIMAIVGNGDGATVATGRPNFHWIRLVNDNNRLTQCYCMWPLVYGDFIYVRKAQDRKLTYYEFVEWIRDAAGGTVPPTYHNLLSARHLDTTAATPPGRGSLVTGQGAAPSTWAELVRSTQGFFLKDDGTDINWYRIAAQTCHVGPGTECEAATLGAAVGLVNAAGPPTAANPWVILVDAIVTVEVGDVTVPQYCRVVGRGENSVIGMGANSLILSNDSGLERIRVTSTDPVDCIRINNCRDFVLVNVVAVQGAAAICFNITGTSGGRLFECEARATTGGASGFVWAGTSSGWMYHCYAVDTTNFASALSITSTSLIGVYSYHGAYLGNANDVTTVAATTWYHLVTNFRPANSVLAAGTHHALPTKRFNQTVVIAEEGGDFQTLSQAITWINAQADAAANKLYGVLMLAGNYAEAASVTVPQYVHVEGMGEGTEIEFAANQQLILSSDSSLMDVVVEGTPALINGLVYANNAANVILRNVHAVTAGAGRYGFQFSGTTSAKLYDCLSETSDSAGVGYIFDGSGSFELYNCRANAADTNSIGFNVQATSTVALDDCIAEDTTNFNTALNLTNTSCICIARFCTFRAVSTGNDILTGAASTLYLRACRIEPSNCGLSGTCINDNMDAGDSYAFAVKNTSGGARAVGDVGYIDEAGEFKTTTTQYDDVNWAVVVTGGPNNDDIYVARRGRVTVKLDANCSIGDYLYTSGTATQATPQSYMRPEMFAVALTANAAGAGGTCEALLYCHTKPLTQTSSVYIMQIASATDSDFRATINAIAGPVVTYNAPISGNDNTIDPVGGNLLGKLRLYNETDADYALIDDVNTVANQITLTANAPAGWAVGETITTRSQTCVDPGAPPYYYEVDLSDADNTAIPVLARTIDVDVWYADVAVGQWIGLHPYQAYAVARAVYASSQEAGQYIYQYKGGISLINRRFCIQWDASGAATTSFVIKLQGYREAAP